MYKRLDGRLITYKMLRQEPVARNSAENIEKRRQFSVDYQNETRRKVHLDETNFNLLTLRKFGRSAVGSRALIPVRASKGVNLNVILAVDDNGLIVRMESHLGSIKEKFKSFMTALSSDLEGDEVVIYMDNASIHVKAENFECVRPEHTIRRFDAPYSPQLNPCEFCFSVLKAAIRRYLSSNNPHTDRNAAANTTLAHVRARLLQDTLDSAMEELTRLKIRNFYRLVDRQIANCARGLPLRD